MLSTIKSVPVDLRFPEALKVQFHHKLLLCARLCNVSVCVYLSIPAGMQAFYEVKACGSEARPTVIGGVVRNYYLAAENVLWNYAPSGKDLINDVSLTEADR